MEGGKEGGGDRGIEDREAPFCRLWHQHTQIHPVLGHCPGLQVTLNVPRIQVGNTHQEPRTCEGPQFPETEYWLWGRRREEEGGKGVVKDKVTLQPSLGDN